jgi:hypothetical protein
MGFGSFDENEQERREKKKEIDDEEQVAKPEHKGTISLDDKTDTDDLLDAYEQIDQSKSDG